MSLTTTDCMLKAPRMLLGKKARTTIAVLAGYAGNAILVAATEQLLAKFLPTPAYLIADLFTQCLYEVLAGFVCCRIAERSMRRIATFALIGLGLLIGSISLITSWNSEPRWYGIALLCVWTPCIWIGYALERSATDRQSSKL